MNWRRGLLRLWLIAAACWLMAIGGFAFQQQVSEQEISDQMQVCADQRTANPRLGNLYECFQREFPSHWGLSSLLILGFSPIVLALILGATGAWVIAGFARPSCPTEAGERPSNLAEEGSPASEEVRR